MLLVKKLVMLLLVCTFLLSVFAVTASAAYVTDGNGFYEAGDLNGDKMVDICDLVAAKSGLGTTSAADLDGDGSTGDYDLALIRAMILGIDNSLWTE